MFKTLSFVFLLLGCISLFAAERIVPVQFNFSATLYAQNSKTTTNGAVIITGPTLPFQVNQSSVLLNLARATHAAGDYSETNFPTGARLYYLVNIDDSSQNHFCVMNTNGTVLANVSKYISFEGDGNPGTHKGGYNTANGTLNKVVYAYMATIYYDDTSSPGGTLRYYLTGLYADRQSDLINPDNRTFTRTIQMQSLCVSGSGTSNGRNISGGGICQTYGKATLPLP